MMNRYHEDPLLLKQIVTRFESSLHFDTLEIKYNAVHIEMQFSPLLFFILIILKFLKVLFFTFNPLLDKKFKSI